MLINKEGKFIKDGIYVTSQSGISCDQIIIKVMVNSKLEKSMIFAYGHDDIKSVPNYLESLKGVYNLPVYDARRVNYSVFAQKYFIDKYAEDKGYGEFLEFDEEDLRNLGIEVKV